MSTPIKSLFRQTAADLMSSAVVTIPQDMSLHGAAKRLFYHQVSGAPVVDDDGRCVGVISAGDFLHLAGEECRSRHESAESCYCQAWQIVESDSAAHEETVRSCMTKDAVTVAPATPLQQLTQMMVDGHIHRLIVLDKERRPIGVVASTDILAAVARAREPMSSQVSEFVTAGERF
jgi:CBS-domain-containing membrane protein